MWEIYLVETMTGNLGPRFDLVKIGAWEETINKPGSFTFRVPLSDLWSIPKERWKPYLASAAAFFNGEPVLMGPILSDPKVSPGAGDRAGVAEFSVGSVRDILKYRVVTERNFKPNEVTELAESTVSFNGPSYGNIAWELVRLAQHRRNGSLPIRNAGTYEPDAGRVRNYQGFNLSNNDVNKRLEELSGVINGPDILFVPEWADERRERLQWAMLYGTHGHPTVPQEGIPKVFDLSAPRGPVLNYSVETEFVPIRRAYGTGAGEGSGTLIRMVEEEEWDGPMLEVVWSDTSTESGDYILSKISELINNKRIVQFAIEVDIPEGPVGWNLGEWHSIIFPDNIHPLIPGGVYNAISIKRSGSFQNRRVKVEFQSIVEEVR